MPYKPLSRTSNRMRYLRNRTYDMQRPARHKIYNTTRWQKLREYKRHLTPLCEECLRQGRVTPAELVDHIVPIEEGGAVFELDNLQSLCKACHNRKHADGRGGKKVWQDCCPHRRGGLRERALKK